MSRAANDWFADLDPDLLEPIQLKDITPIHDGWDPEQPFAEEIETETARIEQEARDFAERSPTDAHDIVFFTSGGWKEGRERYIKYAAMINFLKGRDLLDPYLTVGSSDNKDITAFNNQTLNQAVNWYFVLMDRRFKNNVNYKFINQVGDDGESWSFTMRAGIAASWTYGVEGRRN